MSVYRVSDLDRYSWGIVRVYQQAFGGDPWNEGYKCQNKDCDGVFPLSIGVVDCPTCAAGLKTSKLVEYWPKEQVCADFNAEMAKAGAICVVAADTSSMRCGPDVHGFAWGYDVTTSTELDNKLEAPGLSDLVSGTFFYLDECAVSPSYQGDGLGKQLVACIFKEQPHSEVLLRTLDNSRMCRLIKHMGGETLLNISRGRVIMKLKVR